MNRKKLLPLLCVLAICYAHSGIATADTRNPHGAMLQDCNTCHTATSWTQLADPMRFSHESTGFPLVGRHVGTSCQSCHTRLVFAEAVSSCVSCHADVHSGEFGNGCEKCHTANRWDERMTMQTQHAATRFPLTGRHALVDCQSCHSNGQLAGLETACVSCHREDFAASSDPSHTMAGFSVSCESCHNPAITDWKAPNFTHGEEFPLTAGHANLRCVSCHTDAPFAGTETACISCHRDDYISVTEPNHQGSEFPANCLECHTTSEWSSTFDHQSTAFPLVGRHLEVTCTSCHSADVYDGLTADCWSCHASDYQLTDTPDHQEIQIPHECQSCHTAQSWNTTFDHNLDTQFPLTGGHIGVSCKECHDDGALENTPASCEHCHIDDYRGTTAPDHEALNLPVTCADCHTTDQWDQAFDHNATQFPLTGAHVQTACQQCHVNGIFEGTPSQCIDCHLADYNSTTDPDHEAAQISTNCTQCHTTSDWDASFDHQTTAFPLTGAHVQTACQQCHVNGIFEGTPSQCIDCHLADYNGTTNPDHEAAQISTNCTQCHTTSDWDASFDHNATPFPLTGAHVQTACQQCHVNGIYEGTPSQCIDCHLADYNGTTNPDHEAAQISTNCTQCHTTSDWDASFDHNATQFPLTGAHVQATCQQCHVNGIFEGTPSQCIDCHLADYNGTTNPDHEAAQISTNCTQCHTTSDWDASFDHNATQFPLTGAHVQTACQQCHVNGIFEGTPSQCIDCHLADYNATSNPDHEAAQISTNCTQCHTTSDWDASFDHNATQFPLTGAHVQTACQQCHVNGIFEGTPSQCIDCHLADYNGTTNPDHEAVQISTNCTQCHTTSNWDASFDHQTTAFPLTGAHVQTACQQCHVNGIFEGTPSQCIDCHLADYNGTTNPDHEAAQISTNCTQCHTTSDWDASFDHNATQFPLTGAHVQTACQQCHVNGIFEGTPSQCIDCHLADYNGTTNPDHEAAQISTNCTQCHTTSDWDASFDHNATPFPLTGAHVQTACQQCHVNGVFEGTPSQCIDCHLADYNGTTNPDHDAAQFPTTCQTCHTTSNWNSVFNHSNTSFPLTGAHVQATCNQCHASGQYDGLPTNCLSCHQADYNGTNDPDHEAAQFPTTCQTCHTTSNWNSVFNHGNTSFPLTGAHIQATCNQCHASGQYDGLPTNCLSCHQADYNGTNDPDHEAAQFPTTCQTCHTTSNWNSVFNHSNTSFPLTGAHIQASCNQCHASGQYDGLPTNCLSCHQADYNGTDDPDHDAAGFSTQCQTCHTTTNWDANFNHSNTSFPLTGAHIQATCNQCHASGQYDGLPTTCVSCHLADYNGTDDPDHEAAQFPTTCQTCHTTTNWDANFNHSNTSFPLTGAHIQASCNQCHANGIYNGLTTVCYDCHLADYNGSADPDHQADQYPTNCQSCHTTSNWTSTFNHAPLFPINSGAHRNVWTTCWECHRSGNFADFSCTHCHEHRQSEANSEHQGVNGYVWQSSACYSCHPNGRSIPNPAPRERLPR